MAHAVAVGHVWVSAIVKSVAIQQQGSGLMSMAVSSVMQTSLIWAAAWDHIDVYGLSRAGLVLAGCSTQESGPCTTPGKHSRAGPGGREHRQARLRV